MTVQTVKGFEIEFTVNADTGTPGWRNKDLHQRGNFAKRSFDLACVEPKGRLVVSATGSVKTAKGNSSKLKLGFVQTVTSSRREIHFQDGMKAIIRLPKCVRDGGSIIGNWVKTKQKAPWYGTEAYDSGSGEYRSGDEDFFAEARDPFGEDDGSVASHGSLEDLSNDNALKTFSPQDFSNAARFAFDLSMSDAPKIVYPKLGDLRRIVFQETFTTCFLARIGTKHNVRYYPLSQCNWSININASVLSDQYKFKGDFAGALGSMAIEHQYDFIRVDPLEIYNGMATLPQGFRLNFKNEVAEDLKQEVIE
jgi:hypothetical protein